MRGMCAAKNESRTHTLLLFVKFKFIGAFILPPITPENQWSVILMFYITFENKSNIGVARERPAP
jgi:hypothetical protein